MSDDFDNIDISSLLRSYDDRVNKSLKELFDYKIRELNVTQTQALEIMQMTSRSLLAILEGTSSRLDVMSIIKLSKFLEVPMNDIMVLFLESIKNNNLKKVNDIDRRKFILQHFDINELKKEGILEDVSDFDAIERKLVEIFDYSTILDYRKDVLNRAYSSAKLHKPNPMVEYWIEFSRKVFIRINNPNAYDRTALINFFPTIRWHSMNVEKGLWEVVKALYYMGITVIYLPKFKKLHIRGATFSVNKKPCIILTDYRGYYPTLWFALLHELHHVLFDWDDILVNSYHISDKADLYTEVEIEEVANNFAREYLFPEQKMKELMPHINNPKYIQEYAKLNHVHPSIPYIFIAYDKNRNGSWGWVDQFMPDINESLNVVKNISLDMSVRDISAHYINNIYQ